MQCQSYFPSYNSHYDLNMDNNGGVKPIYNGNGIFRNGHYNNFVSSLPVAEFFRQTILMQEVTFRDQVQELHRVYRRQKELMDEIRSKELHMNHLHLGTQCSDSFSEKFGQNTIVRESKGKKIGGKLLDLELPAEEYIDIEEGGFLEDGKSTNAPNTIDLSSNVSFKVVVENNPMASSANKWWDHISRGDSLSPSSFAQTKTNLADLNEPLIASSDFEDGILEGRDSLLKVSCFNNHLVDSNGSNRLDLNCDFVESLEFTPNDTPSSKGPKEADIDEKEVMHLSREDDVSPRRSKRSRLIDINLPCDPTNEENQPVIEEEQQEEEVLGYDNKNNPCQMNLNLSMNDDGSPRKCSNLDQTTLKIDLEAPPSPEVEERPLPRGYSEDTQPEDGNDDPLEELVKIAANAIVSISSSSSSSSQPSPEKCENFDTMTLEWFAGLVVDSVSVDLETHTLDEFEAMTLNLTEMKEEEHLCFQNTPQIENFSSYSMPLSGQKGKGRTTKTRRSKRKDFQSEVLPSLASLSRYEVTEDIQMIEGLMQAAGTPWHLSRARRASRMGRKPWDKPISSESKSPAHIIGWGKANRRPRGQRNPASPTTVLSKWLV